MTTEKRIACIDCKYCEYKPLSEEEKEEYYQADRDFRQEMTGLSLDDQERRSRFWKPAHRLIRMKEYTCLHYKRELFDNLSGKIHTSVGIDCKTYRDDPFIGNCGTNAKFFEPKNKVIPIVSQPKVVEPKKEQPQTVKEYLEYLWKEIKND